MLRKAIASAILAAVTFTAAPVWAHPAPDIIAPIFEDSAVWDCHHMGNRTCGPNGPAHADWYLT